MSIIHVDRSTKWLASTARVVAFGALALGAPLGLSASQFVVAPGGSDTGPGSAAQPFRTIQQAASAMRPSDVCVVRGGVYRESVTLKTSGAPGKPSRFEAAPGELVILSGADPLEAQWKPYKGAIYQAKVDRPVTQVFVDGAMMVAARWPNARLDKWVDVAAWATSEKGSVYGTIVDQKLAQTGIDWTGGKVAPVRSFQIWNDVPVLKHATGSASLDYRKAMGDRIEKSNLATGKVGWVNQLYYLSGKLAALDAPGEWFAEEGTLYLWTPSGDSPANHRIELSAREQAFTAEGLSDIELRGLHFVGAGFAFEDCHRIRVNNCHLRYLAQEATIVNTGAAGKTAKVEPNAGGGHVVSDCSIEKTLIGGLLVSGEGITIENCFMRDIGSECAVYVRWPSDHSVVRGNTILDFAHKGVQFRGPGLVELNHIFNGGYLRAEAALIQTGNPNGAGSVIRRNWIHDCLTCGGGANGIGIRGDDQTRQLTMDHNVVWNCNREGINMKGDENRVINNTCFANAVTDILSPASPEPEKVWLGSQWPLLEVQNAKTILSNNYAPGITGGWIKGDEATNATDKNFSTETPPGGQFANNYRGVDPKLENPAAYDFRPREGSPLIDAGKIEPGFTDGFQGAAPDIGAYERGGEHWRPGCRNGLWVSAPETLAGGAVAVRVALRLPPIEPVELSVAATAAAAAPTPAVAVATLEFTRDNWMTPQTITLTAGLGAAPSLRFSDRQLGDATWTADGGSNGTVWFDRPMIPTTPVEFVYGPANADWMVKGDLAVEKPR